MWTTEDEARDVFALVTTHCGGCWDYHLSRSYLNLGGVTRGPERDRQLFAPLLARLTTHGSRVLLAGVADTGLLDFVRSAIGNLDPHFTVADQCETPLSLCRRYAEAHGISIETRRVDLIESSGLGTFDLIVAHLVLGFVPAPQRIAFLRNLAGMLAADGKLIVALAIDQQQRAPRPVVERVLATLAAKNIELPGDGTALIEALRRFETHSQWRTEPLEGRSDEVEGLFIDAGLEIIERNDLIRERPTGAEARNRRYLVCRRR